MCGCGAAVPQVTAQPQQQRSVSAVDASTNATSTGSVAQSEGCTYTVETMKEWKEKLNALPHDKRFNYNIYMGYVNSGLAVPHLICGSLYPMMKTIGDYIATLQ